MLSGTPCITYNAPVEPLNMHTYVHTYKPKKSCQDVVKLARARTTYGD